MAGTLFQDNLSPYLTLVEQGSTPASPSAGDQKLFVRSSDHVLCYLNSSGTVTPFGSGGGSGADANHPLPLDSYAIDGTYGDDFTAGSLSGSWTRRNFTSGAETYAVGKKATYLRIATASRTNGDGYFRTAPAGDWTFAIAYVPRFFTTSGCAFGLAVVDSSGTGVGVFYYNGPQAFILYGLTTYTSYGGTYYETGTGSTSGANVTIVPSTAMSDRKVWLSLRKSGTSYYAAFSLDGEGFSPECGPITWSGTVDRVAMMMGPIGTVNAGGSIVNYVDVDWFNKIA